MGELDWYATSFGTHRSQKIGIMDQRSPRHSKWTFGQKIPMAPNLVQVLSLSGVYTGQTKPHPGYTQSVGIPSLTSLPHISKHGTQEDKEEMLQMLEDERR
jgi:hypothetical protein